MNPGVGCKLSDLFAKEQQSNSSTNVEGMHNPEIYGPDQSYQQQGTYEQFVLTQKQNFLSSTGQEDNGASYENQQMYGELQSPSTLSNQSMSPSPPPPPRVYKPCVVCNDKSSGYHYGVSSCEGCKGFFRRSVQKNMQYTCHKDKNCTINKVTRNRCQYCRLQKCFARGMSKEAVRSDRNKKKKPKPESTTTNVSQSTEEMTINDQSVIKTIVDAHKLTFPYTMEGKELPVYSKSSGNMVESEECSMESDNVQSQSRKDDANVKKSDVLWETIIDFSPAAVLKIVEFAKKVPGFLSLALSDQITLLKSACLEIMILRLTHRYDPDKDAMIFEDKEYQRGDLKNVGLGPGADFIFKLAASLKDMDVDETEIAMLSAICLISGDRSGLEEPDKIEQLQEPLLEALRRYMRFRRSEQPNMFPKIIIKLIDLRDLSIQSAIKVLRSRRESSELELPPLIVEMLDREENVSIP